MSKKRKFTDDLAWWWDNKALPWLRKTGNEIGAFTSGALKSLGFDIGTFAESIGIENPEKIKELDVNNIFDQAVAKLSRANGLSNQLKDTIYALSSKVANPNIRDKVLAQVQDLARGQRDIEEKIVKAENQLQTMRQDALTDFDKLGSAAKKNKATIVTKGMELMQKSAAGAGHVVDDINRDLQNIEQRLVSSSKTNDRQQQ